ncbi:NAD(P)H-dependent glycerol-3-phosphate dehydrogenase [Flammeovirgaceae bacterium SG7u.111]|nr:NAD(P)H-dependent glycerol-3-phosphate dehydrogenase [Flammeovirgaceae bacterium SG7u.132]WPO37332.1 NAD(P)H-dependent glycerol-3-phosphate dehydrogenase [Flammeovirgaceae bacterium SG7u.111]
MKEKKKNELKGKAVAVIGAGSWATAIVKILSQQSASINWWVHKKKDAKKIAKKKKNPRYLSSVEIDIDKVTVFLDIEEAIQHATTVILAVPAAFIGDVLEPLNAKSFEGKAVISAIKGMIPEKGLLITDYVHKEFGVPTNKLGVIAGPCHAEEVAMEKQSYLTISSEDFQLAKNFAEMLNCHYIKTSINTDIYGVEYAAIMKNVFAIACGIAHGLNYGDNFQAVLVSNALREIEVFLEAISKKDRQISASAYLGDLLVTTYSQFSRNRTFGNMIGRGYSVKFAQLEMEMIAEGYYAVRSLYQIQKRHNLNLPIIKAVYNILYEKISPIIEFTILKNEMK